MGRNLADGGRTPVARHPTQKVVPAASSGNPRTRQLADGMATPRSDVYRAPTSGRTTRPASQPRQAAPVRNRAASNPNARTPLGSALIKGGIGAAVGAAQPAPPPPVESFGGSGRSRGFNYGSAGSYSGGGGGGGVAPVSAVATGVAPPPAAVQPPPVVNPAGPGGNNVGGAKFDTVGTGIGTYGQEQRRRQARGPMTGLSITPEMLRRAATQRIA